MRAALAFNLLFFVALSGCTDGADDGGDLVVKATNSGSTDLVISIDLTRDGSDVLQESRTVPAGGSTSWTHAIDTESQYRLTTTAAGSNGGESYQSSGGFPPGNCNGADFVVTLDAAEVVDGGYTEGSSTGNCV